MSSLNPIGFPFIELPTVDSTNNYAMGLVHAGMAQHGTAVFAHEQTRGRGQRNREWISEAGSNIALSIVIEPGQGLGKMFLLSQCIAVGVLQFLSACTGEDMTIKWPNDIYWRDRKAGGILIENSIRGEVWKYAVAGIGLNINQTHFGALDKKAVSLKQITGKKFDPHALSRELCALLDRMYMQLPGDSETIVETYRSRLYKRGEMIQLKKDNRLFKARLIGVTDMGQLEVEHTMKELFSVGEVEWII